MRRIFAIVGAVALAAAFAYPANGAITTGYHWSDTEVTVVDAVGLGAPLERAVASWNAGPVHLTLVSGKGGCRFQRGVVRLCDVRANDVAAWTEWKIDEAGHFTAVRVTINSAYAAFRGADPGFAEYVLCHELGHALGLAHDDDEPGCLSPTNPLPAPAPSDFADLARLYDG